MNSVTEKLILVYGIADTFPQGSKAFRQLQLQDTMKVPDIEQIVSLSVKVEINNSYIISTAAGSSYEGQVLTGKKLIVEGKLQQKLEYAADLPTQPINTAYYTVPFSTYIVLGEDISCYSEFEVTSYIEDIYIKQMDRRTVFKNILLLLNAVPIYQM